MNASLYQAAAALDANSRWQEVISQNLASSVVPGYKKQEVSFAAFQAGRLPVAEIDPTGSQRGLMPAATTSTNFTQGEMKYSGVNTDLAIEGPAFFEIQLPDGTTAYTRDGEFQIDSSGQLVTKEGFLVLGSTGTIQIDTKNPAPIAVSASGEISQGADRKGELRLVEFADLKTLTQISGACFVPTDPETQPKAAIASTVRQGFLEGANTSSVMEMANLIAAMRNFETNQRVIQVTDDRMAKMIRELGEPS